MPMNYTRYRPYVTVDLPDRNIAEHRIDELLKCRAPLASVLEISPASFLRRDELLGAFLERDALGHLGAVLGALGASIFQRVDIVQEKPARILRMLARLCER